jgi:OOP family OmpA-OmpF porin
MTPNTRALLLVFATAALSATAFNASAAQPANGYWNGPSGEVWKDPSGLCWRSGDWTPGTSNSACSPKVAKTPAPKPLAKAAPKPAPEIAAAPPPASAPAPQKVTLRSDALFPFNRASLTPADMAKLDTLANRLSALKIRSVIATGHADPLGSSAYNKDLSLRRADSVRSFLISKGISADRIRVKGRGARHEVKVCPTDMSWSARVACLAPDRRVQLQVTGTKAG